MPDQVDYPNVMLAIAFAILLFGPKSLKQVAIEVAEALHHFKQGSAQFRLDPSQVSLASILGFLVVVLIVELAWLSTFF